MRWVQYRFFKWNLTWNSRVRLWIFLESHSLLSKWRKARFIHVCVTVAIFNARSRKAIPVESTVKTVRSQRMEIQLESEKKNLYVFGFVDGDNGFENMIKRSLFLIVFELLFYCRSNAISRKASLSRVAIPRWIPRLGNQSGCENSLSYAILY